MPELIDKKRTEAKVFLIARFFIDRPDREVELVKAVIHRCCEEIDKQPTIEAEPVRRGRRIEKPPYADETVKGLEFQIVCSRCDEQNSSITFDENSVPIAKTFYRTRYCPHCGARMDGGADNG